LITLSTRTPSTPDSSNNNTLNNNNHNTNSNGNNSGNTGSATNRFHKPKKNFRGKKPGGVGNQNGRPNRTERPEQINRPGLYRAPEVSDAPTDAAEPATALAETAPAVTAFTALGLSPQILRAVREEGYETPTPIQVQAIPPLLEGRDVFGCAQTGTGKTAAFALPILQHLLEEARPARRVIRALVLSPTRELAIQIEESFADYAHYTELRHLVIFGGVGQNPQVEALKKGVDILVATPGRLLDLQQQGFISLKDVSFLVLDEADRMLDMGFIHDIRKVLRLLPTRRQNLLFSATMPPDIAALAREFMHDPVRVEVTPPATTVERIEQRVMFVDKANKRELLADLLRRLPVERAIVFTRTKHGANRLVQMLEKDGFQAAAIHGNKSQNARQRALDGFKDGDIPVLVATDIAARGIDVDGVSHVFNFDIPHEPRATSTASAARRARGRAGSRSPSATTPRALTCARSSA
jgi:ATP-dependent RNA helicase RhlE